MNLPVFRPILDKINEWPRLSMFLLGGIGILAFCPFSFYPALVISFSAFLLLMNQPIFRESPFKYAFIFSYGHYLFGFYWIGNALLVYDFWYVLPFFWLAFPSFLAFFQASAFWIVAKTMHHPLAKALMVAVLWSFMDYLKGTYIMSGLPWNLYGYIWGTSVLQVTSVIGIYGLSLLTAVLIFSFASRSVLFMVSCASVFVGFFIWGEWIVKTRTDALTGVNIRLIQASIPQNTKWLSEHFRENFEKHLLISMQEAERPLNLIIWPEASIPTFVEHYPTLREDLANIAPNTGFVLVGGPRLEANGDKKVYTSLFSLNQKGEIVETYDKSHLVPFGEYMPFKEYLPIGKLTPGNMDYSPGAGLKIIKLPGIPSFTPLICFEAIFPGQVTPLASSDGETQRPEWLLNQTNDAWYGRSTGPYQHLQSVQVRAIEEGLPLVRAANNGISAVIDPYGRILHRLELDDVGFMDFDLPKPIDPTYYSKHREMPYFIMLGFFALWAVCLNLRGTRRRERGV